MERSIAAYNEFRRTLPLQSGLLTRGCSEAILSNQTSDQRQAARSAWPDKRRTTPLSFLVNAR